MKLVSREVEKLLGEVGGGEWVWSKPIALNPQKVDKNIFFQKIHNLDQSNMIPKMS